MAGLSAVRPVRRRLRRRQQHGPRPDRHRGDRPRVLLRLAHRRRGAAPAPALRPHQRPGVRPGPARPPWCRAARAAAGGSSCACRTRRSTSSTTRTGPGSCSAPWDVTPDDAVLERHAVYRFQARWAERWRRGRALLAGDAAHQMPPFAGQGMCSGLRDAANLAWKLDLVLDGQAPITLLDAYEVERAENVRAVIDFSMSLGKVICITDPEEAAARDELLAGGVVDGAATARRRCPASPPGSSATGDRHAGACSPGSGRLGRPRRALRRRRRRRLAPGGRRRRPARRRCRPTCPPGSPRSAAPS